MPITEAPARTTGGLDVNLYNLKPDLFRKWNKALIKLNLGAADAKILCVGDSNTLGYGTSDANRTSKNSWNAQLTRVLAAQGLPAVEGMTAPQVNGAVLDNRVTSTGTWDNAAFVSSFGWGQSGSLKGYWQCSTDTSTRTFTPGTGVTWDRADIYYTSHTGTGNATIQATGGSAFNLVAGGVTLLNAVVQKTTISAGSLANTNTVTITKSGTTTIYILGIEVWNSTKPQLRVANVGIASSSAQGWASSNASYPNLRPGKCIQAYQPDLTFISLGTNDAKTGARTQSQYLTDLQTIITDAQVSGDVVLIGNWPYGEAIPANLTLIDSYNQGLRGLGKPLLDNYGRMGAYAAYNTAGFMFGDGLHGNDYAAGEVAQWINALLRRV